MIPWPGPDRADRARACPDAPAYTLVDSDPDPHRSFGSGAVVVAGPDARRLRRAAGVRAGGAAPDGSLADDSSRVLPNALPCDVGTARFGRPRPVPRGTAGSAGARRRGRRRPGVPGVAALG